MHKNSNQDTKSRLFNAAIKVFAQKGYDNATVRAICDLAGANVAAVNYHYGDKENLYAQVLEHVFAVPREKFGPYRKDMTGASPEERLHEFIINFYNEVYLCGEDCEGHSDLAAIYLLEMAHPSPKLDDIVEKYIRPDSKELNDILTCMIGENVPKQVRDYCSLALVGQILSFCHLAPISERLERGVKPEEPSLEELSRLTYEFSLGGINRIKALYK